MQLITMSDVEQLEVMLEKIAVLKNRVAQDDTMRLASMLDDLNRAYSYLSNVAQRARHSLDVYY